MAFLLNYWPLRPFATPSTMSLRFKCVRCKMGLSKSFTASILLRTRERDSCLRALLDDVGEELAGGGGTPPPSSEARPDTGRNPRPWSSHPPLPRGPSRYEGSLACFPQQKTNSSVEHSASPARRSSRASESTGFSVGHEPNSPPRDISNRSSAQHASASRKRTS